MCPGDGVHKKRKKEGKRQGKHVGEKIQRNNNDSGTQGTHQERKRKAMKIKLNKQ